MIFFSKFMENDTIIPNSMATDLNLKQV